MMLLHCDWLRRNRLINLGSPPFCNYFFWQCSLATRSEWFKWQIRYLDFYLFYVCSWFRLFCWLIAVFCLEVASLWNKKDLHCFGEKSHLLANSMNHILRSMVSHTTLQNSTWCTRKLVSDNILCTSTVTTCTGLSFLKIALVEYTCQVYLKLRFTKIMDMWCKQCMDFSYLMQVKLFHRY